MDEKRLPSIVRFKIIETHAYRSRIAIFNNENNFYDVYTNGHSGNVKLMPITRRELIKRINDGAYRLEGE